MRLHDKTRLLSKVARIANALGYDVARLSKEDRDAPLAHAFSNAVDELRAFQRKLAVDIKARQSAAESARP
jgi:hypothetical protein